MLGREEGETDLAGREGDIRVRDASREGDCRWCEGVVGWDFDLEVPESACEGLAVSWIVLGVGVVGVNWL